MFARTVIKQGEKIHDLEAELNFEKETNAELRNENIELTLKLRNLEIFKNAVKDIMKKGTIVEKHDKIKELVDNLDTEN